MAMSSPTRHTPVIPEEVLEGLHPQPGQTYIDATAGFGGHAAAILERIGETGQAILVDQDPDALAHLRERFGDDPRVTIVEDNFRSLTWETLPPADLILFDIGVSSAQLDEPERGFSFQQDGPLDMRMDQAQSLTAATIVNTWAEQDIANTLFRFGEERQSRAIARAIVKARENETFSKTLQLSALIHATIGKGKHNQIDSATRSFQALRIAVNDELAALTETLPRAAAALSADGRLAVISFHSLEDRIVKHTFATLTTALKDQITGQITVPASYQLVTKKPLIASATEIDSNPRARSAKLRIIQAAENKPKK